MKYNYIEWKAEFFGSKHENLSDFLREKTGAGLSHFGGNSRKHLQGWAKEKKSFMEQAKQRASETVKIKNAEHWEFIISQVNNPDQVWSGRYFPNSISD